MREIFVHQDSARVGLYQSILESAGIPTFMRNSISGTFMTELPAPIFFPVLCVANDEDYDRAMEVLGKVEKPEPSDAPDWKCPACGETVPGTFDACWKCQAPRGGPEDV
jgi:hypothetical protein